MPVPVMPGPSAAKHEEGFLNSKDNLRLFWQRYTPPSPQGTVAVIHGAGDHSGRYAGLTSALVAAGFSAALLDYRGHGQSDGVRWHVDRFSEYLDDLDAFVTKLEADQPGVKPFIVAHSNGGLIAALWAMSSGSRLRGLVLSSPFLALAHEPPAWKRLLGNLLRPIAPRAHVPAGLEYDQLTSDPEMQQFTARDPLYLKATTPRWFAEVNEAQKEARRRAAELTLPLLVLVGGADPIADPGTARAFHDAAGSADKEFQVYEGFRHEIFNEVERERPFAAAIAWITARASARPESR